MCICSCAVHASGSSMPSLYAYAAAQCQWLDRLCLCAYAAAQCQWLVYACVHMQLHSASGSSTPVCICSSAVPVARLRLCAYAAAQCQWLVFCGFYTSRPVCMQLFAAKELWFIDLSCVHTSVEMLLFRCVCLCITYRLWRAV